jgi:CDP-diacylglycerol--glycerol-3-phosphate 3-phosphatidyltransferase
MELKKNKLFNISNSLSFFRIFLVFPTIYLFSIHNSDTIYFIAFLAILSDYFDGYFARSLNQITDIGKILDPLADKILIGGGVIALTIYQDFPLWLTLVIVCRDFFILLGALLIYDRKKHVTPAIWPGKVTVTVISVTVLSFITGYLQVFNILIILTFISILFSAAMYTKIFLQNIQKN